MLTNIFINKKTLLNTLLTLGLLIWMLIQMVLISIKPKFTIEYIIVTRFLMAFGGFIVFKILYKFFDYVLPKITSKRFYTLVLIASVLVTSVLWVIIGDAFCSLLGYLDFSLVMKLLIRLSISQLIPVLAFTGIYFMVGHWSEAQKHKENTLKATSLANEAQAMMLRYQINPHFLFNALNTIRAVILDDKEKARSMITELSDFFRYTLAQNINDTVELSKEIDAVKSFLEIQKIRFEENLQVVFDIDKKTEELKIPIFIIHPLVENAIKYGIQTSELPLTMEICTSIDRDKLRIEVSNSGKMVEHENHEENGNGTNTGLRNIEKRLKLFYGENASFELKEYDKSVKAIILIHHLKTNR